MTPSNHLPHTTTNSGLHAFVADKILVRFANAGIRAADLGCGPGAMAERLRGLGCDVVAADMSAEGFEAHVPHVVVNFDQPDFASRIGCAGFGLVTAIEVIEHVESPIGFLRNIGNLLSPGGVAVVTTPNVESLPARTSLELSEQHFFPEHGFQLARKSIGSILGLAARALPNRSLRGDNHVWVLRARR
jgi:2-polyprenyl-3-methyl-5-hydroxy-6-metoxy-1,4-benzoquinol methylase